MFRKAVHQCICLFFMLIELTEGFIDMLYFVFSNKYLFSVNVSLPINVLIIDLFCNLIITDNLLNTGIDQFHNI